MAAFICLKHLAAFLVILNDLFVQTIASMQELDECVSSIELKYITGQVDLDCVKSYRTVDDHALRLFKRALAGSSSFSSNSMPASLPKNLMEVNMDMKQLLEEYNGVPNRMARKSDEFCTDKGCYDLPESPCETVTDVVTPINATSATSGKTVWIAQYPGLFIQTLTYSKCKQTRCSYLNGACKQLFSPYLLMTIPGGPVSIFGQDYILVESGCSCQPELPNNRSLTINMENFLTLRSRN